MMPPFSDSAPRPHVHRRSFKPRFLVPRPGERLFTAQGYCAPVRGENCAPGGETLLTEHHTLQPRTAGVARDRIRFASELVGRVTRWFKSSNSGHGAEREASHCKEHEQCLATTIQDVQRFRSLPQSRVYYRKTWRLTSR
jgi:hypothetical protein